MSAERFEIVTVPCGERSLRSLQNGETFHPGIGPMAEARLLHVEQHALETRVKPDTEFGVWDVGLGAGANALALIEKVTALGTGGPVELRSFDVTLDALRFALEHAGDLGYPVRWAGEMAELIERGSVEIGRLRWVVEVGDFRARVREVKGVAPGAVLFDPYSPRANPEMWTREVFQAIRERAASECTLSSYSRSTVTRAELLRAGWCVGRGSATGEKTETTVAATRIELLRAPLGRDWLERVRRSRAAGLLTAGQTAEEVAEELARCPQMIAE